MSNKPYIYNTRNSGSEIIGLIAILLFAAALRIPTFFEPWGGDQGVYGYIANGILEGKVPYRDMYTNTGYGLYFTYALFFKLFGNNMMALHIGDFIAAILTVLVIYFLARELFEREAALLAAGASSLFISGMSFSYLVEMKEGWGTYWHLAQREIFMAPLIAAAILLIIKADRQKRSYKYFISGVFIGLAIVYKVTAVLMLLILLMYILLSGLFSSQCKGFKFIFSRTVCLVAGVIAINLPFLYYFWINDSLSIMYEAVFVHTSIYAKLSRGHIIANAFQGNTHIMTENLLLWLFTGASLIYLMVNDRKREHYLVAAWTIVTLMMIWGQGKFFGYHFLLIIPPFSLLTGYGIKKFMKSLPSWKESFLAARKEMAQILIWTFVIGNLAVFAWNGYEYYRWHFLYLSGKISKTEYYEVFNEYPVHLYSFRSDYEVAEYLKKNASPGSTLRNINGGGETVIHYLSGLKSPTRFTSTWYLFSKDLYDNPLTELLRSELIEGIRNEKPDYMLLVYFSMEQFRKEYTDKRFVDVRDLMDYIQMNYKEEKVFRDGRILYKRI